MAGIETLSSGGPTPPDWDDGVYRAIATINRSLDRRAVSSINFATRGQKGTAFTKTVAERVKKRLEQDRPMELVAVVGRLMMVDFHPDKRRCRIEPPNDRAVECTYPLDLRKDLRELAQRYVRAQGFAETRPNGEIQRLSILRIEPVSTPAGVAAESTPRAIDSMIEEQAPPRFETADDFVDPELWDSDEEVDAFLLWVNTARGQAAL